MSKFMITGSAGFIGGALSRELEGNELTLVEDIVGMGGWRSFLDDSISRGGYDCVFHVGACSDTQNYDVPHVMPRNVEATFVIADACARSGTPMVYSSSASTYGNGDGPETLYSWSKYVGERYAVRSGAVALRYFNVYGYDESRKGTMASFIYQAMSKSLSGKTVSIFPPSVTESGLRRPSRDFVYVQDVVSANLHALKNYETLAGGIFDVGTGTSITYESLLDEMGIPYEYCDPSEIPPNYQSYTKADPSRFMPGWSPTYPFSRGVSEYLRRLSS